MADLPIGPKKPYSTVLTVEQEAVIVAFRKHTLLPLDDCLYTLQATIPALTRSSLHRCLERHGISRLPEAEGGSKPGRKKFARYPIGYFHIDLAEVRTAEGKLYLFVAIDRTSKFVFVELVERADMRAAAAFLEALIAAVPYRIHIVLTDNGIQFADLPKNRKGPTARFHGHPFDRVCLLHGIDHRLTKPNHPWTNGQVEPMNRTIKEATVQRYHYDDHQQLRTHLADFVAAYNFAKRLKTLGGLTAYEFICKCWQKDPNPFTPQSNPSNAGTKHLARSGIAWRMMPNDLPPWRVVYQQMRRWMDAGCFQMMIEDLRLLLREFAGRAAQPTAVVIDGRTLQSTPESGVRAGYDGAKRRKGSKVHAMMDPLGHLLALHVTPADEQDRAQVGELARQVQEVTGERVELAFVDQDTPEKTSLWLPNSTVFDWKSSNIHKPNAASFCCPVAGGRAQLRLGRALSPPSQRLRTAGKYLGCRSFPRLRLHRARQPLPLTGRKLITRSRQQPAVPSSGTFIDSHNIKCNTPHYNSQTSKEPE